MECTGSCRKTIARYLALLLLSFLIFIPGFTFAWGFWAHKKINYMACFSLPPELFGFYKQNIDYLRNHAVDPDKRRHSDLAEPPRHYIDLDHYGHDAVDSLPRTWKLAAEKLTEDTMNAYGIVPWYIPKVYYRLLEAFREKDADKILYYSANLGHYLGDACVPLHCTENYNGQLTNQYGIHGFWESRLPELFAADYDFITGRAEYIKNIQEYCWFLVKGSSMALDSVLGFEKQLNQNYSPELKYSYEARGSLTMKVYSREYSEAFHRMLDGQVERRMRIAIQAVASFWYTAWVNAGSPDLGTVFPDNNLRNQFDSIRVDSMLVQKIKFKDCE